MRDVIKDKKIWIKAVSQQWGRIAGIIFLGAVSITVYEWVRSSSAHRELPAAVTAPTIQTVTALGKLVPHGEVIKLTAPTASQENRLNQLLVQEGDHVKAGQLIAVLYSHDRLKAAFAEAEEEVSVAQAKLAVTQAGAKQGEIEAQRAEIARLEAERQGNIEAQAATVARLQLELQNAQLEFNRYQSLYQDGVISASQQDNKQLIRDTAQRALQEAQIGLERLRSTTPNELNREKATLAKIAEVSPEDIHLAQAEVNRTLANLDQAKASLAETEVRSPIDGEILYINTRAGEAVSTEGIVEIGKTQQMQVIAEVYQSDVGEVHPGQRVRVTGDAFSSELRGTVERVGSQVRRQTIVNTDPSANIDGRVVEVYAILDAASSQRAAKFTNLQVKVVIEP
jgi:HlyD family secretion protein